jgi:myo-inositol-1(or 4)-monophosphatase
MTADTDALDSIDSNALVRIALTAAREAGALVKAAWRKHPAAEHKGRTDLVTRFDRESETLLNARLSAATPYPIVGEEHGGERAAGSDALTWYVDPIDGTTNFVHGHPFWCVSVGLLAGTRPVLGAVVAPSLGTEWIGVAAGQGTRSGERCRVSDVSRLDDALLATGFPYDRETSPENNFDAFVAIKKKCQAVRRCGSAALDLCLVADGTYDGYWENKLKVWDVAAGAALVLAAGGRVTDYSGRTADLTTGQIVATNGHIHDALVTELGMVTSRR